MYCPKCNNQVEQGAASCPFCNVPFVYNAPSLPQQAVAGQMTYPQEKKSEISIAAIVAIITAFLAPIGGIIFGIIAVYEKNKADTNKYIGIAAIIIGAILALFSALFGVGCYISFLDEVVYYWF